MEAHVVSALGAEAVVLGDRSQIPPGGHDSAWKPLGLRPVCPWALLPTPVLSSWGTLQGPEWRDVRDREELYFQDHPPVLVFLLQVVSVPALWPVAFKDLTLDISEGPEMQWEKGNLHSHQERSLPYNGLHST